MFTKSDEQENREDTGNKGKFHHLQIRKSNKDKPSKLSTSIFLLDLSVDDLDEIVTTSELLDFGRSSCFSDFSCLIESSMN